MEGKKEEATVKVQIIKKESPFTIQVIIEIRVLRAKTIEIKGEEKP